MRHLYVKPGQVLWYCNRDTGELGTVQVKYAYTGEFIISYGEKLYRLPYSALGKRLFFTRKGAACPSEILKDRARREKQALTEDPEITFHVPRDYDEPIPSNDRLAYERDYLKYINESSEEKFGEITSFDRLLLDIYQDLSNEDALKNSR